MFRFGNTAKTLLMTQQRRSVSGQMHLLGPKVKGKIPESAGVNVSTQTRLSYMLSMFAVIDT